MLDLCLWRARIGSFHAVLSRTARNFSFQKDSTQDVLHVKQASGLDVFIGYVFMCTLLCFMYVASEVTVNAVYASYFPMFTYQRMPYGMFTEFDYRSDTVRDPFSHLDICTIAVLALSSGKLFSLAHLILLSGDVEQHPGPGPSRKDDKHATEFTVNLESKMAEMFSSLECNLKKQVADVLSAIEKQSSSLKRLADAVKELEEDQKEIKNTVSRLADDISDTRNMVMQTENKIKEIEAKQDEIDFATETLENEIDRLEGFSRRNNVRFFGIPESEEKEDEEACAETVRNVLKTYIPEKTWSDDVVERAHRLGRHNTGRSGPRPLIAKFQRWGDAMSLMRNRGARSDMEVDGLRVAQDITRRQSTKLRELRSEGKTGYFVNGQLRIKEDTPTNRRSTQRPSARGHNTGDSSQPSTSAARARAVTSVSHSFAEVTSPVVSPSQRPVSPEQNQRSRTRSTAADTRRQSSLREAWKKKDNSSKEQ